MLSQLRLGDVGMDFGWPAGKRRDVVLRALLSLMLAFAPFLAQAAMSVHSIPAVVPQTIQTMATANHDHTGHDHGQAHEHLRDHAHDQMFTEHVTTPDTGAVLANSDHDHGQASNVGTTCPSGHGNHDGGSDPGCCGTFCHSVIALLGVPRVSDQHGRSAFISFSGMPTESVVPDQPHRPPSVLVLL
jgi:hypothetical protein